MSNLPRVVDNSFRPNISCKNSHSITNLSEVCNFSASSQTRTATTTMAMTEVTSQCVCACVSPKVSTENISLAEQLDRIRSILTIDKKETSLMRRSKTSVSDNRVSAQGIGYAGGIILVFIIGGIVALDLSRLSHDIHAGITRCASFVKKSCPLSHW